MADGYMAGSLALRSASHAERIEAVDYTFYVIDGLDPDLRVRRFEWTEGLSMPYCIEVDLVTQDLDADLDALLGASVELSMERSELLHSGYGIVDRVQTLGVVDGKLSLRLRVVPALQLLEQRVDTRIFQGQTVPEILEEVLSKALAEYGRTIEAREKLSAKYLRRDCCVQFRESDLAFCSRLMEEEGIAYYFEPDDDAQCERMVLVDDNANYGEVELLVGDEVPIIPDRQEQADRESLQSFDLVLCERINRVVTRGYNWKAPGALDEGEEQPPSHPRERTRELFVFDDQRQIVDDPVEDPLAETFTGAQLDQRWSMARRTLERVTAGTRVGYGRSNVVVLTPGLTFTLGEHPRDELDQAQFLVTRVVHRGEAPEVERVGREDGETPRYANEFECIPIEQPFRPAQVTPKPRVHGAQTATVMGSAESSDEVHTDSHGRIKLRFHWDRRSPLDGRASCWVRVAQPWAGDGWGTLFIPRVGMEVVVDFLDGNPDRPLAIGCVYNGSNRPPYTLPHEKTRSTIKTSSTPGGGGFNELRLEDGKGKEEIYLHAQKDLTEHVGARHSTTVGRDQSNTVRGHQTLTVEKNRTVTITGSQNVTITGAEPEGGVRGSKLDITGDYQVDASETIQIQAPRRIELRCKDSVIVLDPEQITLRAATIFLESSCGGRLMLTTDVHAASSEGADVLLDSNAKIGVDGVIAMTPGQCSEKVPPVGTFVEMSSTKGVGLQSAKGAQVTLDEDVSVAGAMVMVNGKKSAEIRCIGSGVSWTPSAVCIGGPTVTINGTALVEVDAPMIKLD